MTMMLILDLPIQGNSLRGTVNWSGAAQTVVQRKKKSPFDNSFSNDFSQFKLETKNNFENINFCPSLLGQKSFVCFAGELKKPEALLKLTKL